MMTDTTKKCNRCGVERSINDFAKDSLNNYRNMCEKCREYRKKYRLENKEKCREQRRKYRLENKEKIKKYDIEHRRKNKAHYTEYSREYFSTNKDKITKYRKEYHIANREKVKEQSKKYNKKYYWANKKKENARVKANYNKGKSLKEDFVKRKYNMQNPEKRRQYRRKKYYSDPAYRILHCMRGRIKDALSGALKSQSTIGLLGCTALYLKNYLSKYFLSGMSWENYGKGIGKWNADHIVPCAIFNLIDPSEQKQCFHYTNLRPLWERGPGGNFEKHDKTEGLKLLYNDPTPFV